MKMIIMKNAEADIIDDDYSDLTIVDEDELGDETSSFFYLSSYYYMEAISYEDKNRNT